MKRWFLFVFILFLLSTFYSNAFTQDWIVCGKDLEEGCSLPIKPVPYPNYKLIRQPYSDKITKWNIECPPDFPDCPYRELFYMIDLDSVPTDKVLLTSDLIIDAIENAFQTWKDAFCSLATQQKGKYLKFTREDYNTDKMDESGYITITWNSPPLCSNRSSGLSLLGRKLLGRWLYWLLKKRKNIFTSKFIVGGLLY